AICCRLPSQAQNVLSCTSKLNLRMPTTTSIRISATIALLVIQLVTITGCRRDTSNQKRYELKGKVLAVEKDKHLLTVAHDDIKDFMKAMTMPFMVREDWVFDVASAGDQITATLVVDGTESWLEGIIITKGTGESPAPGAPRAAEAQTGDVMPDFALVNQNNRPIRLSQYRGNALLLTFIYTRCPIPEYCTLMSNNFAAIDQELQKQPPLYQKTRLLSISIDPEYDTPAVLRSYGASHTGRHGEETFAHWEFATGTKEQVKEVAQFFGLQYHPEQDQIVHGLRTAIIAPDGKVAKVYRGNEWKPEEVLADLKATSLIP
ncbi:MAG: SCO family protein, partial [Pyrinomonadaceae bacterium]